MYWVLLPLGILVFIKGLAFVIRWYEVTGRPDFSVEGGRVSRCLLGTRGIVVESLTTLVTLAIWCVEMPVRLVLRTAGGPPARAGAGERPVILAHGFMLTPWSLWVWWLALRIAGRKRLYFLDYYPALGDIDGFAGQLAELVDRVGGAEGVDVVAHSMGGVITARYMGGHPGRVRTLVAVGTPFHGTRMWAMTIIPRVQLRPGSELLRETLATPDFPGPARVTTVYSRFDQIVLPHVSARLDLPGVHNVAVDGVGHNALLYSPQVIRAILKGLRG